jgi:hypothetical protein
METRELPIADLTLHSRFTSHTGDGERILRHHGLATRRCSASWIKSNETQNGTLYLHVITFNGGDTLYEKLGFYATEMKDYARINDEIIPFCVRQVHGTEVKDYYYLLTSLVSSI